MESIVTSFKKRQRQIIDAFIFGFNSQPLGQFHLEIEDSEFKGDIRIGFFDKVSRTFYHTFNLNLKAYQLNDVRPEANTDHLRFVIYKEYEKCREHYENIQDQIRKNNSQVKSEPDATLKSE